MKKILFFISVCVIAINSAYAGNDEGYYEDKDGHAFLDGIGASRYYKKIKPRHAKYRNETLNEKEYTEWLQKAKSSLETSTKQVNKLPNTCPRDEQFDFGSDEVENVVSGVFDKDYLNKSIDKLTALETKFKHCSNLPSYKTLKGHILVLKKIKKANKF